MPGALVLAVPTPSPPLTARSRAGVLRAVAATGGGLSVGGGLVALVLHGLYADVWPADLDPFWRSAVVWALAVGGPGSLLAWRRPEHPVGWLALAAGLALALSELGCAWTVLALAVPGSTVWFDPVVLWFASWLWVPGHVLLPTLVVLLLPEGRLPAPRWRLVVAWDLLALATAVTAFALTPWDRFDPPVTSLDLANPFAVTGVERLHGPALGMLAVGAVASVASLVVRLRTAEGPERQQLKWVLLGATLTVALGAAAFVAPDPFAPWVAAVAVLPLVACTTVAVLRHRLWDVETFIARSAIYGLLTLMVAAAYLTTVGLVGARLGDLAPWLALLLVAAGLQPARSAVQRQVNRLLYGHRDDPYTVLAALGQRLEGAAGTEPGGRPLSGVAGTVAAALRFPYVAVAVDDEVASSVGRRPPRTERFPLVHRGEPVGWLDVGLRRGETRLSTEDRRLVVDLTRQLAGAAYSVRLQRDLLRSREQIVNAREEERRRLHRDLHDDLGPSLAALVLQLDAAHDLVGTDPDRAQAFLRRLSGQVREAVGATRRIVADLRPPALDELGLTGALQELAARFGSAQLQVTTDIEDADGLPAAAEVVLVRVAGEALHNVARHSGASHCRLRLAVDDGAVVLEVVDDGVGIADAAHGGVGLTSIRDRVAEIGGRCRVERAPGGGTRVLVTLRAVL